MRLVTGLTAAKMEEATYPYNSSCVTSRNEEEPDNPSRICSGVCGQDRGSDNGGCQLESG